MTPVAALTRAKPCEALRDLLLRLALSGVEVAPNPNDPERLRYRPAVLSTEQRDELRRHKPAVLALLRGEGVPGSDSEAAYILHERLGVAEELGMPTHPGSPAWLVAVGEAMGEGCYVATDWIH